MLGDYLNNKTIYSLHSDNNHRMTRKERDDLTFLTIKIGLVGVTALLSISMVLVCIMVLG